MEHARISLSTSSELGEAVLADGRGRDDMKGRECDGKGEQRFVLVIQHAVDESCKHNCCIAGIGKTALWLRG